MSHFISSATALTFFSVRVVHVLSVAMQIFALQTVKSFLQTHFPGLKHDCFSAFITRLKENLSNLLGLNLSFQSQRKTAALFSLDKGSSAHFPHLLALLHHSTT